MLGRRINVLSSITTVLWGSDPFFALFGLQIFFASLWPGCLGLLMSVWPLTSSGCFRFFSVVQLHQPIPHSPNDVVSCNSHH